MPRPPLFVGLTTWNSALFLDACLEGVRRTTRGAEVELFALDNGSTDATLEILARHGVPHEVGRSSQPDALNALLARSRSEHTLLLHPDTVLLADGWLELLRPLFDDPRLALVSPEDIGCGPWTRPWGKGMPESSFLLFHTARIRRAFHTRRVRRFRIPFWPRRVLDFYSPAVTHNLPARLAAAGLTWLPLRVLASRTVDPPPYAPAFAPPCWEPELGALEYGLGNFYAHGETITHYHNWFDRFTRRVEPDSTEVSKDGLPLAYLWQSSQRFLADYRAGAVGLPPLSQPRREPRALPVRRPS